MHTTPCKCPGHDLVPAAAREQLIRNGERAAETGETGDVAVVKIFDPCGRFTFYAFDGEEVDGDFVMFGFVVSPLGADCDEWGRVSLAELQRTRGQLGLPLERDLYFGGVTAAEINAGERP